MTVAKTLARPVRDAAYRFLHQHVAGRRTADQVGVDLLLDHPAISNHMYYVMSKDYESRDALLASTVLNPDSQVLELGASSGFMAIYCRKIIGVRNYAMVEASPRLPTLIEENFKLNGLDPAATPLIRAAAAAEDGSTPFTIHRNSWSSSVLDRGGETIRVPALALPSIIAALPFMPDTLIADIEGGELDLPAEHYALFGTVILETHPKLLPDGRERADALLAALTAAGFTVRQRAGDSFVLTRG